LEAVRSEERSRTETAEAIFWSLIATIEPSGEASEVRTRKVAGNGVRNHPGEPSDFYPLTSIETILDLSFATNRPNLHFVLFYFYLFYEGILVGVGAKR